MSVRGAARAWARLGLVVLACVMFVGASPPAAGATGVWSLPPSAVQPLIGLGAIQSFDSCSRCHRVQAQQWRASVYGRDDEPVFVAAYARASRDTSGDVDDYCPRCHIPQALLSRRSFPPSQLYRRWGPSGGGVTCDICHTISGLSPDWPGNGSFLLSPGSVKRGQLKDAVSPAHRTAYSKLHTRSGFCGTCHSQTHPTRGFLVDDTYGEWAASTFAKQNITCQDCHMPKRRAQAAKGGPMRDDARAHTFAGGNVRAGVPALARAMLRRAARVQVTTGRERARRGDKLTVEARVTNIGAGHAIPTGMPELRRMWLELRAVDGAGQVVAATDEVFTTVYEDTSGVHDGTVPFWRAAKVYSDTRIGPGVTVDVPFDVTVPPTMAGDALTIEAVLLYQSLPDSWAKDHGLKGAAATNPITVMAEATPTAVKVETTLFDRLASAAAGVQATTLALRALFLLVLFAAFAWLATLSFRARRGTRADALGVAEAPEVDVATPPEEAEQPEEPPLGYTPSSDKARTRAPRKRKG